MLISSCAEWRSSSRRGQSCALSPGHQTSRAWELPGGTQFQIGLLFRVRRSFPFCIDSLPWCLPSWASSGRSILSSHMVFLSSNGIIATIAVYVSIPPRWGRILSHWTIFSDFSLSFYCHIYVWHTHTHIYSYCMKYSVSDRWVLSRLLITFTLVISMLIYIYMHAYNDFMHL